MVVDQAMLLKSRRPIFSATLRYFLASLLNGKHHFQYLSKYLKYF